MSAYDAIVVGLGAMGGSTAEALARAGARVLGLDRYAPPHALGSSHGRTRLIREAYFEHPAYVPLVQRAYAGWAELERWAGKRLLQTTGALMLGPPDGEIVQGALRSARQHALAHETLSAAEISTRFPALQPPPGAVGVWEPRGGLLDVEACITAQLARARNSGATLHLNEPVTHWRAHPNGAEVTTSKATYHAGHLVLAAGPWLGRLLPGLHLPLAVERQVMFWFAPQGDPQRFAPPQLPAFLVEYDGQHHAYAFPDVGHGLKVALHHQGQATTAQDVRRDVDPDEIENIRALLARFLPEANGRLLAAKVCLYTNTPDEHFVLDAHPNHPQVTVVSACSGHGFKFAPAIGQLAAERALGRASTLNLGLFQLGRF